MLREQLLASLELSLDEASEAWIAVSEHAARFLSAWKARPTPPEITEFLPAQSGALRRLVLVELLKVDLEQRREAGATWKKIEQYVAEFPELQDADGLPSDLIYEEFRVRQQTGEQISSEEYLQRFPEQSQSLRRLLGIQSVRASARRPPVLENLDLQPGQQLDDFDLLKLLGKGTFAKVFLAFQRSMQRRVALKVCGKKSDEPQTMAQLDHPHIVRVFDQRNLVDRAIHLVYMEYVAGGDLGAVVAKVRQTPPSLRSGAILVQAVEEATAKHGEASSSSRWKERLAKLSWGEVVCSLGAQLAGALDHAHAHGTLHRDLKPANVLLTAEGIAKLVDFNISYNSKLEGASPAAFFGGSPGYMSPEQLEAFSPYHDRRPDELDGRADVYALGVLLWELLTGRRPFGDEMVGADVAGTIEWLIVGRRRGVSREMLNTLPNDLPAGLREVLLRALEPDLEKRFHSAGEMARELQLCLNAEVCSARQRRAVRWYPAIRRHVALVGTLIGLLPNAVLSVANVLYDFFAIVGPRLPEPAQIVFLGTLTTLVKGGLYLVGIIVGLALAWPAFRPLQSPVPAAAVLRARCRSLILGDVVFWVSISAWATSGVVFPAWIDWSVGAIQPGDYIHFLASHILCGLIAGTLGFFLMSLLAVRIVYPSLLELGPAENVDSDERALLALGERLTTFSRTAVVVPFLAAVSLGLGAPGFRPAFAGLAALGLIALIVTSRLLRAIQADLRALLATVTPDLSSASDSTVPWAGGKR